MDSLFKGNLDKCILIISTTNQKTNVNVGEYNMECNDCEKLLGVKIDSKLTFDCHVSGIYKKASRKLMHYPE